MSENPDPTAEDYREAGASPAPWYSRYFRLLCILGFGLAGLAVFAPALGDQRLIYGRDTRFHDYIMHLYGWERILETGQWPLWCPELFCGLPFVGSFALCPFYPSQWLYFLLPFNTGFTCQYALALTVGGLAMGWWVRRLGAGRGVAVWAGLAFMASGHFLTLTHAGHLQKMIAIAWAPMALGALTRSVAESRGNSLKCYLVAAVAFAMQLLAGHPQIFYATALAGAGTVLAGAGPRTWRQAAGELLGLVLALGCAIGLAGIQMFPGLEMAPISNRAGGVEFAEAVRTSYPPLELLEYVIPSVLGDSVEGSPVGYFGRWGSERVVSDYLGAPLLLLALLGLMAKAAPKRLRLSLAAIATASVLVGLGEHTPLYRWLYDWLPGWKSYRSPGSFMFLADLGLIALAALGLEHLVRTHRARMAARQPGEPPPVKTGAANLLVLCLLALAAAALSAAVTAWWKRAGISAEVPSPQTAMRLHLLRGAVIAGLELSVGAALLAFGLLAKRRSLLVGLAVVAVLAPAVHNARYIRFEPLRPFLHYLKHPVYSAAQREAPWEKGPARLLEEQQLRSAGILSAVGTPFGYHPIILRRWQQLVEALDPGAPPLAQRMGFWQARTSGETPPNNGAPEHWNLLGRFGTAPPAYLWKRDGAPLPYAQRPERVQEVDSVLAAATRLRNGNASPATVLVEANLLRRAGGTTGAQLVPVIDLVQWKPHRVELSLQSAPDHPILVPLAEVAAPGWRARTSDGKAVPVLPVNVAQRAILIPAKTSTVVLEYAPFSVRLGVFVSLVAAGCLLVHALTAAAAGIRRRHSRA